jgi:hypothetical protein
MEHIKPQNAGEYTPDHLHEESDINVKAILAFAIFLAVSGLVIHVGLWFMYNGLDRWAEKMDPAPNPMTSQVTQQQKVDGGRVGDAQSAQGAENVQQKMKQIVSSFPEPRLQPDEVRDMDLFRQAQERDLHTYGKVDASGQTVHIPIERAMEIIAERGQLPNFGGGATSKNPPTAPQGQALGQPGQSSGTLPTAADKTTKKR